MFAAKGNISIRVLSQDQHWQDKHGNVFLIDDMAERYKLSIMNYLLRCAPKLKEIMIWASLMHVDSYGEVMWFDSVLDELDAQDSEDWMRQQPLYIRLRKDTFGDRPF